MEPARVLLHGIGGVGKTTLAYQVAALRQSHFPGGTVKVELNNHTPDLVLSDLIEALTGRRPQPDDWFKLVRAQLASRPPMLVILDNVRLDEAPWNQPEVMESLLQALTPATLVMTSRSRQAPAGFTPLELKSLPDEKATELAGKLAKQKGVALVKEQAALLGRLLGGLPFAIERAVELMHSDNHSAQSLLAKLQAEGRDPEGRLAKLLDWSYDALDADAKAVLVAMGQLAEAPVPEVLLAGLLPQANRAQGLQRLLRSGLIDRTSPGATTYHMHTLVLEWAGQLGLSKHRNEVGLLKQHIHYVLRSHDPSTSQFLIDHIMTAQRQAESSKHLQQVISIVNKFDDALESFGYWETRKDMLDRAILAALAEQLTISDLLKRRGVLATIQRDYIHARKLFDEALGAIPYIQDTSTLERKSDVLCALGVLDMVQDNFPMAEVEFQDCLSIRKRLDTQAKIANALMNLGNLCLRQKKPNAAMQFYNDSLRINKNANNALGVASALVNQGRLLLLTDAPEHAKLRFTEAVGILKEIGRVHELAMALLGLAEAEKMLGHRTESLMTYRQSASIFHMLGELNAVQEIKQFIAKADPPNSNNEPHSVGPGDNGPGESKQGVLYPSPPGEINPGTR